MTGHNFHLSPRCQDDSGDEADGRSLVGPEQLRGTNARLYERKTNASHLDHQTYETYSTMRIP